MMLLRCCGFRMIATFCRTCNDHHGVFESCEVLFLDRKGRHVVDVLLAFLLASRKRIIFQCRIDTSEINLSVQNSYVLINSHGIKKQKSQIVQTICISDVPPLVGEGR